MTKASPTPKPYLTAEKARAWFDRNTEAFGTHRLIAVEDGSLRGMVTDRATESPARSLAIAYFDGLDLDELVAVATCGQLECCNPKHLRATAKGRVGKRTVREVKHFEPNMDFDEIGSHCSHPIPPTVRASVWHCNGCGRDVERTADGWQIADKGDLSFQTDEARQFMGTYDRNFNRPARKKPASTMADDEFDANFLGPRGAPKRRISEKSMTLDLTDLIEKNHKS